jgi:hypothetical protein
MLGHYRSAEASSYQSNPIQRDLTLALAGQTQFRRCCTKRHYLQLGRKQREQFAPDGSTQHPCDHELLFRSTIHSRSDLCRRQESEKKEEETYGKHRGSRQRKRQSWHSNSESSYLDVRRVTGNFRIRFRDDSLLGEKER